MNKEIMEAVTKHLPAMQMEALKQELEKAKLVDSLRDEMAILKTDKAKLAKTIEDITQNMLDQSILKNRVEEVEKRERTLEVELLKKDYSCAESKFNSVRELMLAAFKNPSWSKSISKNSYAPNGSTSENISEINTLD